MANHRALPASARRLGAVGLASPSQVAARRRRRAAGGAVLAIVLIALGLVVRSAGQDQQQPEEIPLESSPLQASESFPTTSVPPPEGTSAPLPAVTAIEPPPDLQGDGYCPRALPSSGSPCAVAAGQALICGYPEEGGPVTCSCQAAADVPATWSCVADRERPRMAICPAQQPSAGVPCAPAGLGCVYDAGVDGTACTCQSGEPFSTWTCVPYLERIAK